MDITDKIDIMLVEVKWKKVVRGGKLIKKLFCPDGFKAKNGKCIKMSAAERRKRAISTKRAQKKLHAGGKAARLLKKRAKSMRKRTALIPTAQADGSKDI